MSRCSSHISLPSSLSAPWTASLVISLVLSLVTSLVISLVISTTSSVVMSAEARAELYTYEREDGVIVISSEPPTRARRLKRKRPKRRKVQRRKAQRRKVQRRKAQRHKRQHHKRQRHKEPPRQTQRAHRAQRVKASQAQRRGPIPVIPTAPNHQEAQRAPHRELAQPLPSAVESLSTWRPSRRLRRYQDAVEDAASELSLPTALIWSVITACDELKTRLPSDQLKLEGATLGLSYMSPRVRAVRFPKLVRTDLSAEEVEVKSAANLLRELIQLYRGDLTLALTSYPHAARSASHPVYLRTRGRMSLFESSTPKHRAEALSERQRRARLYVTRRALELYKRSPDKVINRARTAQPQGLSREGLGRGQTK